MKAAAGFIALVFFTLSLAACGAKSGYISTYATQLDGTWIFTFDSSATGKTSTGEGKLVQSGVNVTSTLALTGSPCSSSAELAGTATAGSLSLMLTENGQIVTLTGTVNYQSTAASGKYSAEMGGCLDGDSGTWSATESK